MGRKPFLEEATHHCNHQVNLEKQNKGHKTVVRLLCVGLIYVTEAADSQYSIWYTVSTNIFTPQHPYKYMTDLTFIRLKGIDDCVMVTLRTGLYPAALELK